MADFRNLYNDAERKRLMADMLMQQAMTPQGPVQTGSVTPKYTAGHGLTQLAQALMARRADKKATSAFEGAEQARSKAMADALAGIGGQRAEGQMGPPEGQTASLQNAIEAGADPMIIANVLQNQRLEQQRAADEAKLADQRAYQEGLLADKQGFDREMLERRIQADREKFRQTSSIGQVAPGQYTPESVQAFQESGDYSDLERYEPYTTVDLGGGRRGVLDRSSGQVIGAVASREDFQQDVKDTKQAAAEGTAQGQAMTAAKERLGTVQNTASQLEAMMADPNFDASVGFIDQFTGRIGEKFGSEEGVLGGQVTRMANQLVTDAVSAWKGAISERELDFFKESVPGRGSSASTWRHWYQNEFLPRQRLVERVASGETFNPTPEVRLDDQALLDKYLR